MANLHIYMYVNKKLIKQMHTSWSDLLQENYLWTGENLLYHKTSYAFNQQLQKKI